LTPHYLKCNTEISFDDGTVGNINFYFGGRYYSERHQYLLKIFLDYFSKIMNLVCRLAFVTMKKTEIHKEISFKWLLKKHVRNANYTDKISYKSTLSFPVFLTGSMLK